jgi:FG-GAP-like repeat
MTIWSHAALAAVPTLPFLDLAPEPNQHAGDVSVDSSGRPSSASIWIRRFLTATAAALIGLAATPDLTLAETGVYVGLSDGSQFAAPQKWNDYFCVDGESCAVGDVNGDGSADIIAFQHGRTSPAENGVYVGLSDGSQFAAPQKWNDYFCVDGESCAVGDVDGDGSADIIAFQHGRTSPAETGVYVGLSDGTHFAAPEKWNDYFCVDGESCAVGDVNGDGSADIIAFQHGKTSPAETGVYVGLSDGSQFVAPEKWNDYFCVYGERCAIGDVDGDGLTDVVAFNHGKPSSS